MDEGLEDAHQRVLVLAQDPHCHLAGVAVDACNEARISGSGRVVGSCNGREGRLTLDAGDAKAIDLILCQPERDALLDFKRPALLEKAVEVDMDGIARVGVVEGIFAVPIAESARGTKTKAVVSLRSEIVRSGAGQERTRGRSRPST